MVLEVVIVYSNFMKVGGREIILGVLYGRPKKVIPLVPPHRMAAHPVYLANTNKVSIAYNVYYVK
jgi:hypothetical protein